MVSISGPDSITPHPKGTRARILLSSVFGPYAQDDQFGSRAINPMELYHNQVTREQGSFSLRMFHRSWGLMMIQKNISAPCTLLDFPTLDAFERELTANHYDIVGISGIIPNFAKVREMCRRVRQLSPNSAIIVGGHVAGIPGVENMLDADHIVRGEGIAWMRRYLGEDPCAPFVHPEILSGFGFRILGMSVPDNTRDTAATIVPSVGCPMGCNFCTTSAFFGGKGKSFHFYETGDQLFDVMQDMERKLGVQSFFVMDENFLLNRPRAMRLLERMKAANKAWALYVFSSINAIRKYTMEELVQLGVSWIWVGLESPKSSYAKLKDADTRAIAAELRQHGIKLLGSTIVGLEHHTPENIRAGNRVRGVALHRLPPVHALHAGTGHAAVLPDAGGRPHARWHRPRRHSRPVQIQLPACRHLARRLEAISRLGLPSRLREERSQPLPHLRNFV